MRRRRFIGRAFLPADLPFDVGKQECLPYSDWDDVEVVTRRRARTNRGQPTTDNSRANASMRSEEEDKRSSDNAKNAEKGVDAAMQRRGVRIGFGWHDI